MTNSLAQSHLRVALAVVHRGPHWLVARRRSTAHLGDQWEFPGGRIKENEAPVVAALRELHEECGVLAVVERSLPTIMHVYPARTVELLPFLCRWRGAEAVPFASSAVRWVHIGELRHLAMPDANVELVRGLELLHPLPRG